MKNFGNSLWRAKKMTENEIRHLSEFCRLWSSTMPNSLLQPFTAFSLLIALAGCDAQTAPAPTMTGRPVQVQEVNFDGETMSRDFVGVVRARYESDLSFRVAGKIIARKVNVGDHVGAGDVIAELDPQDLQLGAQSAAAEFAAAKSNLDQAAADLGRYAKLKERGFASNADYDRKKAANDEAEGRMERAKRSLDLARNQLAYAELKADADGVITATLAEPGQVVTIGQGVVRLARDGAKEALVALPETWLGEARNSEATVRLWTVRDKIFAAHLRELSPQADAATRTYAARFDIEDAGDTVAFGMTTTVTLSRTTEERTARLPLSAIFNRGKGPSVFLVDASDTLELRPVTVASFTEEAAVVTSGISEGDKVVTLGVQKLEAGAKVRVVEAQ
jgi:RND family efflux transporter MFP subunit